MKYLLLATLIISTLAFSACNTDSLAKAQKEATEAVTNLNNEALEVFENVEAKVNQIQDTAESVKGAADAFQQASNDLKELTGGSDTEESTE